MRSVVRAASAVAFGLLTAAPVAAQTDYYNTGTGRPLRIEDAHSVEFRAIEMNVAPLRLERARGGAYRWSVHPEVGLGVLPRTQLQVGLPLAYIEAPASASRTGIAGVELAALYTLNAETAIPAMAIGADVFLPVGSLAGDNAYATFKGIMTRTLPWARFHVNAELTAGPSIALADSLAGADHAADVSRWLVGLAADKTFPLRSLLIGGEVFAERPVDPSATVAWSAGAGARFQLTPRWTLDGGLGRRFSGDDQTWYVTLGSAFAIGIP